MDQRAQAVAGALSHLTVGPCVTGPGGPRPSDGPTAGVPGEDNGEGHPSETSHPRIGVALGRRTPEDRGRRGKPLNSQMTAARKERNEDPGKETGWGDRGSLAGSSAGSMMAGSFCHDLMLWCGGEDPNAELNTK